MPACDAAEHVDQGYFVPIFLRIEVMSYRGL
jgi:hypothetical protein